MADLSINLDAINRQELVALAPDRLDPEELKALDAEVSILKQRIMTENYLPTREELRKIVALFRARRANAFVLKLPKEKKPKADSLKPKPAKRVSKKAILLEEALKFLNS